MALSEVLLDELTASGIGGAVTMPEVLEVPEVVDAVLAAITIAFAAAGGRGARRKWPADSNRLA